MTRPPWIPVREVVLERVQVQSRQHVSDLVMEHIKIHTDRDIMTRTTVVDCVLRAFGKTETVELSCPATWWQHVKMVLRERLPRVFGWLRPRMVTKRIEGGAIVAGLQLPPGSRHAVIPYMLPAETRRV